MVSLMVNGRELNQKNLFESFGYSSESLHIDLNGQSIDSIDSSTFNGLDKLEILNLEDNKIMKIQSGLFKELTNLKKISLESNNIISLDKSAFIGLKNLETVCLSGNPISHMFPSELTSLCSANQKCVLSITEKCSQKLTTLKAVTTQAPNKQDEIINILTGIKSDIKALLSIRLILHLEKITCLI